MLQSYSAPPEAFIEQSGQDGGLDHYLAIAKRRLFYFLIPFVIALLLGFFLVAIQRPIYQAEGRILVETQDIPKDLVRPTITDTANQRIVVIQQRIMTRDNLLQIVQKFGLFRSQQQWMSSSQILDLMKERTRLQLVDLALPSQQQNNLTIVFTLSFEYEDPGTATRVANEFLTLILNEDAANRTNRAAETTRFLEQEVKRLQGAVASIDVQIVEAAVKASLKPSDPIIEGSEQAKRQRDELTKLKLELGQKTAIYSTSHPDVIALKKRIAALEKTIADAPKTIVEAPGPEKTQAMIQSGTGVGLLRQQLIATQTALDEANQKLSAARLGENLERNQQSERLQVIEQPIVPQKPIKPNRPKLFTLASALAMMAGFGVVMAAEAFDKSIHSTRELAGVVDRRLIVLVPYITTAAETLRRKRRVRLLLAAIAVLVLTTLAGAFYLGLSIDLSSWVDRSWIDWLTRLSK